MLPYLFSRTQIKLDYTSKIMLLLNQIVNWINIKLDCQLDLIFKTYSSWILGY